MRRSALLLLPTGLWAVPSAGQELVSNGGFEEHTSCPDYISQAALATGWSLPTTGTSDYMHACATDPFVSVPNNQFGEQAAHGGEAYVGLYAFSNCDTLTMQVDEYREYVTHALTTPMVPGQAYRVRFHVSLSEWSSFAVRDVAALLSTQRPYRTDDRVITYVPQVTQSHWLDSHTDWMEVSGCFVADSAYAWITIGNFNGPTTTPFIPVPFSGNLFAYYFVDDVSVQPMPAPPELGPDVTSCDPVPLAVLDPPPDVAYSWSTGATGPSITVDRSGTYRVIADEGSCQLSDSVHVTIGPFTSLRLAADTLVDLCVHPIVRLTADAPLPGTQLTWSTGGTGRWIDVALPGSYTVSAQAPAHCRAETTIALIDACARPVFSPNAFTPDGDGVNDVWRPVWWAGAEGTLALDVFDRWGRLLFSTTDGRAGWDGASAEGPLPTGVYTYRLHASDAVTRTDRTVTGYVTLMR